MRSRISSNLSFADNIVLIVQQVLVPREWWDGMMDCNIRAAVHTIARIRVGRRPRWCRYRVGGTAVCSCMKWWNLPEWIDAFARLMWMTYKEASIEAALKRKTAPPSLPLSVDDEKWDGHRGAAVQQRYHERRSSTLRSRAPQYRMAEMHARSGTAVFSAVAAICLMWYCYKCVTEVRSAECVVYQVCRIIQIQTCKPNRTTAVSTTYDLNGLGARFRTYL